MRLHGSGPGPYVLIHVRKHRGRGMQREMPAERGERDPRAQ